MHFKTLEFSSFLSIELSFLYFFVSLKLLKLNWQDLICKFSLEIALLYITLLITKILRLYPFFVVYYFSEYYFNFRVAYLFSCF